MSNTEKHPERTMIVHDDRIVVYSGHRVLMSLTREQALVMANDLLDFAQAREAL